jgi:molybdopterin/thiamine biosynthesis adenylyltransferase
MTMTLVFPQQLLSATLDRLRAEQNLETCAIFLTRAARTSHGLRWLVFEEIFIDAKQYSHRSAERITINPELVFKAAARARNEAATVVFAHSHPEADIPIFSATDDEGELRLTSFFSDFLPGLPILSLLVALGGIRARVMGSDEEVLIESVGTSLGFSADQSSARFEPHNRQILAFGEEGQKIIRSLRIGIVGLGGTGSIVAHELAHLGAFDVTLIDPDLVETSNLNRLLGATPDDVGMAKVEVAKRSILAISRGAQVRALNADVMDEATARTLLACSIVFCCTDSHGSRAILNQICYQYFIPVIDIGVSLTAKSGILTHINGRIQLLAPGLGCLTCGEFLNPDQVRRDLMSENEKLNDPYFDSSEGQPQPAVISINGIVSSLALTMFLGVVTEIPIDYRYQLYDGLSGRLRSIEHQPRPGCVTCSPDGAYARGDTWELPTRKAP